MDDITANPLFEFAPVAYSVLNLDLEQIAANDRFYSLFGYETGAELASQDLTHAEDAESTKRYIEGIVSGRSMGSIEKRYIRADGSVFWGRLTARLLELNGEQLIVGVIENVQPQYELLEHLSESLQEVSEQAELRARFVSQVSHELRNPLHLIAGTSELLSQASIPMKHRQQATSILLEATSLSRLVDDLLDIGRSDVGRLELETTTFSIRALIDRIRQSAADQAADKGLQLDVQVDEGTPVYVTGDEGRLRQILINLTSNAVKFTEQGSVQLLVDTHDEGELRFRVIDSGPGIPDAALKSIFEPFVRLSRTESGAGLGLAISSRLAALLGGSLTADNIEPRGAIFELNVPLAESDAPSTEERRGSERRAISTASGKHILIVEDNRENQLLAAAQLEALGYSFDIAPDGFEALTLIADQTYDAILMDWHLPGIDGLETTRRVRALEDGEPRVPIIALTARAMPADIEACFEAGADDHVAKPAGLAVLRQVLTRWTTELPEPDVETSTGDDLLDSETLMDLFDNLGDVDLVSSIVTTFLEELDGRVARIVEAESAATVESAAHVLASTSSIVGAKNLSGLAREVEDTVRGGAHVNSDLVNRLIESASATAAHITTEFNRLKVGI